MMYAIYIRCKPVDNALSILHKQETVDVTKFSLSTTFTAHYILRSMLIFDSFSIIVCSILSSCPKHLVCFASFAQSEDDDALSTLVSG